MGYINQSPWNAGADIGQTFANLMLNMAMLKRQEKQDADSNAYRQAQLTLRANQDAVHNALQQAVFERQAPLIEAQTANQQAGATYDTARTKTETRQQDAAQNAGLMALFQNLNPGGVPVNPTTGGSFPATPENIKMLNDAMLRQSLVESAALNPASSAALLRPVEANKDTIVFDPLNFEERARGPVSPENTKSNDSINAMAAILRSSLENVNTLGKDDTGFGKPPYTQNPVLGNTFINSVMVANAIQEKLKRMYGGAMPTAGTGTNGPVRVNTKEERDALPPGTQYIGPDGLIATKK